MSFNIRVAIDIYFASSWNLIPFFTHAFSHNSRTRTFIFLKILVRDLSDFGFITNF